MASHRHLGMDWQASVASVAVNAAKAQKRSETASTGTVSRLRYETEKRSYDLSGYATTEYVDEADASTLGSAEAYADGADEVVLAEAASYTDKGDEDALAEAQAYTDEAVAGISLTGGSSAVYIGSAGLAQLGLDDDATNDEADEALTAAGGGVVILDSGHVATSDGTGATTLVHGAGDTWSPGGAFVCPAAAASSTLVRATVPGVVTAPGVGSASIASMGTFYVYTEDGRTSVTDADDVAVQANGGNVYLGITVSGLTTRRPAAVYFDGALSIEFGASASSAKSHAILDDEEAGEAGEAEEEEDEESAEADGTEEVSG